MNQAKSIRPDRTERVLGALALVMLVAMLAAIARGQPHWHEIPALVWFHLLTIGIALAITPLQMWLARGTMQHRVLGWAWSAAMFATAVISFGIRLTNDGRLSAIHVLSAVTVIGVPMLVLGARRRDLVRHRRSARGLVIGAILIAGFFTFPFGRLMGRWLFG